jgi:predicted HicB family RNase H-like nuclease
MHYRGYDGSVEYSLTDDVLFGKVQGIRSLLSYEGQTLPELRQDFHATVDHYLQLCHQQHEQPEQAFKGSFNVRIKPALHRKLALFSADNHQSINASVEAAIEKELADFEIK